MVSTSETVHLCERVKLHSHRQSEWFSPNHASV